jgi:hypothetical protein
MGQKSMQAQNQHYVPQFLLRNFLSNSAKDQVHVYDKHENRTFITSVRNIMAERGFNDFRIDNESLVSFEGLVGEIEKLLLPTFRKVLESRALDGSPQEKADLAFFLAFQFYRSKSVREMQYEIGQAVRQKVNELGYEMHDVPDFEGWELETEDTLKQGHLVSMRASIARFAEIICVKDFFLVESTPDQKFYLGDNPVALYNKNDYKNRGNLGLGVRGIQISMPLSSDLLLCAWCPSVLDDWKKEHAATVEKDQQEIVKQLLSKQLDFGLAAQIAQELKGRYSWSETSLANIAVGSPIKAKSEQMEFYQSLQVRSSNRYIVCPHGTFDLAIKFNHEFPHFRSGQKLKFR